MSYRISEVAEKTGFSRPTLRYYEQIGLIPEAERTASGYRLFTDEHLRLLGFIARAKRLGLPLEEIRSLGEAWRREDCRSTRDQLQSLITSKLAEVRHRIGGLAELGRQLQDVYAELCDRPAPDRCGPDCGCDIEVHEVELDATRPLTLVSRPSPVRANP